MEEDWRIGGNWGFQIAITLGWIGVFKSGMGGNKSNFHALPGGVIKFSLSSLFHCWSLIENAIVGTSVWMQRG